MSAFDAVSSFVSGATARLRRNAILAGVCAAFAIAALIVLTSAAIVALEPQVGAVGARLIVGGVFALVGGIAALRLAMRRNGSPGIARLDAQAVHRQAQFAQLAMIVEAVLLGYSLSRRSDRR